MVVQYTVDIGSPSGLTVGEGVVRCVWCEVFQEVV